MTSAPGPAPTSGVAGPREPLRVWAPDLPDVDLGDRAARLALAPMVRAHLDRRLPEDERVASYGALLRSYAVVDDPAAAEVAVLPRLVEAVAADEVASTVRRAEAAGLRTLVFAGRDLEPIIVQESVILLHPGPTRGAQPRADVLAVPFLAPDRGGAALDRPDADRPSVAFCGQGTARPVAAAGQALRRAADGLSNTVRPRVVAPPLRGHVELRSRSLRQLAADPRVDDRFLIRDRYRAGAADEAARARTGVEFEANLRAATYALCVRGTGNFSARFYEALSLGRVPLFVDTRCVLPFEDEIDWWAHTVWLDRSDVDGIADRLVSAHPHVLADPARRPEALRRLWEERLTQEGFYSHLPRAVRALL